MIRYYTPHMGFKDLVRALLTGQAEDKTMKYFQEYTGKKYILLTSSCRIALYLAYQSINKKGEVIVSPLTCKSAIDPILWSGNIPVFTDISYKTLNMNVSQIDELYSQKTSAIQVVHHGGVLVPVKNISKKIANANTYLIEDCAQSFGATINGHTPVFYGDIVCFSLIKNAYGIGGGVFATDSIHLYNNAKKINDQLKVFPMPLLVYRIIYGILESNQKNTVFRVIFRSLKKLRKLELNDRKKRSNMANHFFRPHKFFFKMFASRTSLMQKLQNARKVKGAVFFEKLFKSNFALNYPLNSFYNNSFTKLFIYHPKLHSATSISMLNDHGIEAKHLEQRDDNHVQNRFDNFDEFKCSFPLLSYDNYFNVHDNLVSLPLTEDMNEIEMNRIIAILSEIISINSAKSLNLLTSKK